jgi:antitoxin VapB
MATTKVFKSGKSVAVRLPKSLGVKAGTEMRVREEHGHYVLEPVEKPGKIDLSAIYGSIPNFRQYIEENRLFEDRERDWDG